MLLPQIESEQIQWLIRHGSEEGDFHNTSDEGKRTVGTGHHSAMKRPAGEEREVAGFVETAFRFR
jgi:hypothetical protein